MKIQPLIQLGKAWESAFLTSSLMMQVPGPHSRTSGLNL